jgi:adenylate cyclase
VSGVVGTKKFAYDIWGDTVNITAQMEQKSEPSKINISETTFNKIQSQFKTLHRGKIQIKNKTELDMYFIV